MNLAASVVFLTCCGCEWAIVRIPPPLFLKKGDLENRAQLREPANILIFNTTRSDTAEYRCEVAAIDDQRDFDEILISLAVRGTVCRTPPRTGGREGGQIYTRSLLGKVKIMTRLRNQKLKVTQRVEYCTTQGWNGPLKQLKSNSANSPIRASKFKVSRTVLRKRDPSTSVYCLSACSQTCGAEVQRARGRHSWDLHRAAMPGERGLPRSAVPLVPQQRGAPPGTQNQPEVRQLLLQHKPRHRRAGEEHTRGLFLLRNTSKNKLIERIVVPPIFREGNEESRQQML